MTEALRCLGLFTETKDNRKGRKMQALADRILFTLGMRAKLIASALGIKPFCNLTFVKVTLMYLE